MAGRSLPIVVASLLALAAGCARAPAPQPNVVLVTVDALRADALSFAGHPRPTSPRLDALAAEGVAFTQAITSFPGTAPSMPSLMSGLFPSFEGVESWTRTTRHGFNELELGEEAGREGLSDRLRMLAEILDEAGYTTLGFNTNPNLSTGANFHQGFDEYEQFIPYLDEVRRGRPHALVGAYPPADVVVDAVLQRLERGVEGPFFLWLHLMDPHSPYLPPEPYAQQFRRGGSGLTDLEINESVYHLLYTQYGSLKAAEQYPSFEARGIDRQVFLDHLTSLYEAEVRFCDSELARLFDALEARAEWDDSLVLVTADHGEEFLEHGHVAHHELTGLAEELIRIPAVLKPPRGFAVEGRVDELVRIVDFAPTILDYVGLAEESAGMDGHSLRPLAEDRPAPPRTAFFSTIRYGIVRDARWKYRLVKKPANVAGTELLFDIVEDPMERQDLADRHPAVVAEMRARYQEFLRGLAARSAAEGEAAAAAADAADPSPVDPEERKRLEALGYLE